MFLTTSPTSSSGYTAAVHHARPAMILLTRGIFVVLHSTSSYTTNAVRTTPIFAVYFLLVALLLPTALQKDFSSLHSGMSFLRLPFLLLKKIQFFFHSSRIVNLNPII